MSCERQSAVIPWSTTGLAELHTALAQGTSYNYSIAHYLVSDNQMHTTSSQLGHIILRGEGVNFAFIIHAC